MFTSRTHGYFFQLFLAIATFFIPINIKVAGLLIGVLTLNFLLENRWKARKKILTQPMFWVLISFFLANVVGMLYTQNLFHGWLDVETKLSLLLLPIILFDKIEFCGKEFLKVVIKSFLVGAFVGFSLCLLFATYDFVFFGKNNFFYSYLSSEMGYHPAHYSVYAGSAFYFIVGYAFQHWGSYSWRMKYASVFGAVFFLFFL